MPRQYDAVDPANRLVAGELELFRGLFLAKLVAAHRAGRVKFLRRPRPPR
jgi:hypothetical protein